MNVQGEQQQKLDAIANEVFLEAFAYGQLVPTVVTEEMELPALLPENEASRRRKYVVFLDPLDGSSNLDIERRRRVDLFGEAALGGRERSRRRPTSCRA